MPEADIIIIQTELGPTLNLINPFLAVCYVDHYFVMWITILKYMFFATLLDYIHH